MTSDLATVSALPADFLTPDEQGFYGEFGGRFVADTLYQPLAELKEARQRFQQNKAAQAELMTLQKQFTGRPTPLYFAEKFSKACGFAVYLKREDLAHTGAHKINNALGQGLLAKFMGKTRLIAETGAGQHGTATAAVAALLGLPCTVYMGAEDMKRQAANVYRMQIMGTEVKEVTTGQATLKEAVSEALRDWTASYKNSHYILGSALGPDPYPETVRDFQTVIGNETKTQIAELIGRLPDEIIAAVGGGSNSIGIWNAFLNEPSVRLTGVEAGGRSFAQGEHAARFHGGKPGVFQGMKSVVLQDDLGNILNTAGISAGLDYASIGPLHAYLQKTGRAQYVSVQDQEAVQAFLYLSRTEGIIPALESSHALAYCLKLKGLRPPSAAIIVCLSGRGDKDLGIIADFSGKTAGKADNIPNSPVLKI